VTVWCIVVVLGGLFWIGMPVQWLLGCRQPLDEDAWLQAPLLGMAAIVLVLQNLVYLDWPIAQTAWIPWVAGLIGWVWFLGSGSLRASIRTVPACLLGAAGLLYLVHGVGLLVVGARYYVAEGWLDQFHYVSLAHFFHHFPFSMTLEEIGATPCLAPAITLKGDRIGQSMLHAFFVASSDTSARTMFEPLILLSPALTLLAMYCLGRRLGLDSWRALATAVAVGLLPALTALHLEGFLSHALALPLLLLFPVALDDLHTRPGATTFARAALLLAAAAAIYTEFVPLLGALMVVSLGTLLLSAPRPWGVAAYYLPLAAAPILLNPGLLGHLRVIVLRAQAEGACADTYPWALTIEGWGRLWLGDLAVVKSPTLTTLVRVFAVGLAGLAYLGLIRAWQTGRRSVGDAPGECQPRRSLALLTSIVGLAVVPLLVLARDDKHPYQVYKLLIAVSPLLVLGLALLATADGERSGWRRLLAPLPIAAVLLAGAAGTLEMVLQTCSSKPRERSWSALMHGPDLRELQDRLEALSPRDVVIAHPHPYIANWLAYLARQHRVRLVQRGCQGPILDRALEAAGVYDLAFFPADAVVVTDQPASLGHALREGIEPLWSGTSFQLGRVRSPTSLAGLRGAP
jgi:hypothetical protein